MNQKPLAWSSEKKLALLGHLLIDEKFAKGLGAHIAPEWFGTETTLVVLRAKQIRFTEEIGRLPTPKELPECHLMNGEPDDQKHRFAVAVDDCIRKTAEYPLDALQLEVADWYKDLLFRSAYEASGQLYQQGKAQEAREVFKKFVEQESRVLFTKDTRHDWNAFEHNFSKREEEYKNALTFGNPLIDKLITPEAQNGSLMEGQTTILIAGTNMGKSRACGSIVIANALAKEYTPVLWIVHEDPEVEISMNAFCGLLRVSRAELMQMYRSEEHREVMLEAARILTERVHFLWLPPTGLTVETEVAIIRRRNDQLKSENGGQGFKLIVDDYPQKLTAEKVHGDVRHIQAYVYQQLIGLAQELSAHSILPIQTNRTGNNIARAVSSNESNGKQSKPRWIKSGEVSEVFNPIQDAANVISLNRPPELANSNITVYHLEKTKSSKFRGFSVACASNFDYGLAHAPDWNACSFLSDWEEASDLKVWIDKFKGQAVPSHLLQWNKK